MQRCRQLNKNTQNKHIKNSRLLTTPKKRITSKTVFKAKKQQSSQTQGLRFRSSQKQKFVLSLFCRRKNLEKRYQCPRCSRGAKMKPQNVKKKAPSFQNGMRRKSDMLQWMLCLSNSSHCFWNQQAMLLCFVTVQILL